MCKYFGHEIERGTWKVGFDRNTNKIYEEAVCKRCDELTRKTEKHTELKKKTW